MTKDGPSASQESPAITAKVYEAQCRRAIQAEDSERPSPDWEARRGFIRAADQGDDHRCRHSGRYEGPDPGISRFRFALPRAPE